MQIYVFIFRFTYQVHKNIGLRRYVAYFSRNFAPEKEIFCLWTLQNERSRGDAGR